MFAEELAGNSGRRRAQENKAKRLRLKAQQQKKKLEAAKAKSTSQSASVTSNTQNVTLPEPSPKALAAPSPVAPTNHQLSAVDKAEQQRQLRAEEKRKEKAAIQIQAAVRRYSQRSATKAQTADLLSKRLNDISMLRTVLLQTKKLDYIPPPATVSGLVRQLLFVTTSLNFVSKERSVSFRSTKDVTLLEKVAKEIMAGVSNDDPNVNPILVWLDTAGGRARLKMLLRLALVGITSPKAMDDSVTCLVEFLRTVMGLPDEGDNVPVALREFCVDSVLRTGVDSYPCGSVSPPYASLDTKLDLIAVVRHYLLFVSGGSPIPPTAADSREKCVSSKSRRTGGDLAMVIIQASQLSSNRDWKRSLNSRVVTQLLTTPVFSWKISDATLSYLISKDRKKSQVPLVGLIDSFLEMREREISRGELKELLASNDVSLSQCPATPSQCLLANIIQMSRICMATNGTDMGQFDFDATTKVFDLVAVLVDAVPLGTLTSRESSVEWVEDGSGLHKPIILSPLILEQCKGLLVDSYVRRLFNCAIDTEWLKTDEILRKKDDKDEKLESELTKDGVSSAAALAAKEARVDRSRKFWNSSKWARSLTKGVSKLLSTSELSGKVAPGSNSTTAKSSLMNTSSVSKALADGSQRTPATAQESSRTAKNKVYTVELLLALSKTYAAVIARWGGGGRIDIVRNKQPDRAKTEKEVASASAEPFVTSLLNTLAFGTPSAKVLWALIQSDNATIGDVYAVIDPTKGNRPVNSLQLKLSSTRKCGHDGATLLFLFVSLLVHILIITDDVELYDMDRPLPIHQIRRCIQVLKSLLYRSCCQDVLTGTDNSTYFGLALIAASAKAMRDLYDRSSRRPLCSPKLWIISDLLERELRSCRTHAQFVELLSNPVLRVCPFLVSFKRRLRMFERIITTNRIDVQGVNDANPWNSNPLKPGIPVRITRGRILEDGLATMNNLGKEMRQRLNVNYYNEAGVREVGVDAGGLFKEFWTDLCAIAFDPNYALFRVTDGAGDCMYPSPSSGAAHGTDHTVLFEFLGRILGKSLFEGITIRPKFAHFFLSYLRGNYNYLHMLPDLSTVDPQLYNNLMFLKTYDGDATDLCLTFTVTVDDFGGNKEIPLIPRGSDIEVTNANKLRYIELVSKYYVVDRVKEQSQAFTRGLWEVIDRSWLRIFNEPELQVLISGASNGKLDVDDMKANTRYQGGFSGFDRTVSRFWNVVARLDEKQQADLLRFVTSCERPPPLGFASMNPPFTIQRVGILRDSDKLPTSSTCFNTLKLPTYSSEKVLKERLVYAIQSGAGFELT